MPWGRLDDSLYDHPKLDLLAPDHRLEGVGLWAVSISWSNRYLTDGLVPTRQVERLGGSIALADELVVAGLFDSVPTGYAIHDFHDFNDTKTEVLERREKEAKRKAEWRNRHMSQRDTESRPSGTNGTAPHDVPQGQAKVDDVPAGQTAGQAAPKMSRRDSRARDVARIPTRPDPTRPSKGSPSKTSTRATNGSEPLLDARELEAWSRYSRKAWEPFKLAWLARGFKLPPMGDPDDERSQAHVVWEILDNRPSDLVRWTNEAPGKTSHAVVGYLIERWQALKADVGIEDEERVDLERDPTSTPESARDILRSLFGPDQ